MATRPTDTLLTALGFGRGPARLYERVLLQDGQPVEEIAAGFDLTVERLLERLEPLLAAEIVALQDGRVLVTPPAEVVGRLVAETAGGAARAQQRLGEIANALPYLAGSSVRASPELQEVEPIDGEIAAGPDGPEQTRALIKQSVGDLLWLRPDQWMMPWEDVMSDAVAEAVESGRRCRAIYPVRVLTDSPAVVRRRAAIGEEIRLLPELPTRLMVIGTAYALVPEPLGFLASPRAIIRQRGLIELATLLFEQLWAQASPIPDPAGVPAADPGELRRFLLEQLAAGAQDEQIARRLGVSLRTVRRRVADLMSELGATSRFQAGVEATRRGWLR